MLRPSSGRPRADRGANLVEYTLLVGFVVLVCVAAIATIGSPTSAPLSEVQSGLQ